MKRWTRSAGMMGGWAARRGSTKAYESLQVNIVHLNEEEVNLRKVSLFESTPDPDCTVSLSE